MANEKIRVVVAKPGQDIQKLKEWGIAEFFQPGASTEDIVATIQKNLLEKR